MNPARSAQILSRSLWPLAGGSANYLIALRQVLGLAVSNQSLPDVTDTYMALYPELRSALTARRSIIFVGHGLHVMEFAGDSVKVTPSGLRLLNSSSPKSSLSRLLSRHIAGVSEIKKLLGVEPLSIRHIHASMSDLGFEWKTDWQVRYRLNWMSCAGIVLRLPERESSERYPQWALSSHSVRAK